MNKDQQPSSTSANGLWITLAFLIGLPVALIIIRKVWGS